MAVASRMSAARQLLETLGDLQKAGIVHSGEYICLSSFLLLVFQWVFDRLKRAELYVGNPSLSQSQQESQIQDTWPTSKGANGF